MQNISMIAAIGQNNELGINNDLIWRISADLKRFKQLTTGHTIVMGRKTFESLRNGVLPNRRNIVLSTDVNYKANGAEVYASINQIMKTVAEDKEIFIIGGSSVYSAFFPLANRLYITKIAASAPADVYFPEIDPKEWTEVEYTEITDDEKAGINYTYINYLRIR